MNRFCRLLAAVVLMMLPVSGGQGWTGDGPSAPASQAGETWDVSGPFLATPYCGTVGVNAWFDHQPASPEVVDYRGYSNAVPYDGHKGVDFDVHYAPVRAAAAGKVTRSRWYSTEYRDGERAWWGLYVCVDHGNGYVTRYAHLNAACVVEGECVRAGQIIGTSGRSGYCIPGSGDGSHLHFDVRCNEAYVDPYGWAPEPGAPYQTDPWGASNVWLWALGRVAMIGASYEGLPLGEAPEFSITVQDDGDTGFSASPGWTAYAYQYAQNGDMLYTPVRTSRWAEWHPSLPRTAWYQVGIYVPNSHATSYEAPFCVDDPFHVQSTLVDEYHTANQWLNLGTYYLRTDTPSSGVTVSSDSGPEDAGLLGIDAVRFVETTPGVSTVPLAMKDAAMGPVGGTWASGIQVQNHSADHVASISMAFYWAKGTGHDGELAATHTDTVPAGGSIGYYLPSVGPSGIPELPAGFIGSVVISSDQPIGANVNTQTATTSPMRVGTVRSVSVPAGTLYFPQLNRLAGGYTSYLALQNTSGEATEVTIRYYNASNGQEVPAAAQSATIPAHTTWMVYQADNGNLPPGWAGSAIVTAARSLAGVAAMYNTAGGDAGAHYNHYNGFEEGATTVHLPRLVRHYYGYEGGLAVQNVGSAPTDITIRYYFGGSTYTQVVHDVAPRAAAHIYLPDAAVLDPVDDLQEPLRSGSATITASQPVVATGNETYQGADPRLVGRGITYTGFRAGSEGSTVSFPQVLSHYYCQSGGVQVQNVSGVATTVTAEWKRNGVVEATTVASLGPGEAASWYAPNHVPSNWCGSVVAAASGSGALVGIANASWSNDPWTYGDTYLTYEGVTN